MTKPGLQFDLAFQTSSARPRPREPEAPLRLLLLADLGGDRSVPLAARRPLAVDIDRFEAVLTRIGPRITIDLGAQPVALSFSALDDFHPDRLFARVPAFDALRRLREEARDPQQFRRVAAMLGVQPPAVAAPPAAAALDAASDIERLLGRAPSGESATGAAATPKGPAASVLDGWLRELVSPHVRPDTSAEQATLLSAIDAALTTSMRSVLHAPAMRALESAWLGVDRLVRGLELGETLFLSVLDCSRGELMRDLAEHRSDLSTSALHGVLQPGGGVDAPRFGLIAVDHSFGPEANDIQALAALGALGARVAATVLAGALPTMAGAATLTDLADPRRWLATDDEALAYWQALREAPMAAWIGVVLPRVLMRLPYGAATDRVTSFDFDEMPADRPHEAYLWGGGAPSLALLVGQAFTAAGWPLQLAAHQDLEDLPSHIYTEDGERHQQACAELLLGDAAGEALLARGLMPLMSWRGRNAARLLRWQSVASPPRALAGLAG